VKVAAPHSALLRFLYTSYMLGFFLYLVTPLLAAGIFAFNDSLFPAMPWNGFTLDWFFGAKEPKLGMFHDRRLMEGIENSFLIGAVVSVMAVAAGTANAFLFERREFPGKRFLTLLMIAPLVIPGVILGVSILVFANMIADAAEGLLGLEWDFLRPGFFLIVLGQFSFLATIATLVIAARLRKFDRTLEEAAFNLGAARLRVLATVTLPYLAPALFSALIVTFLMSFENFNTTLMLVGSDAPLTITMYDRMAKSGSTPVLNAVSVFLMVGSGVLALLSVLAQREKPAS
jgi:spermidine/putrescine transport system permease protein